MAVSVIAFVGFPDDCMKDNRHVLFFMPQEKYHICLPRPGAAPNVVRIHYWDEGALTAVRLVHIKALSSSIGHEIYGIKRDALLGHFGKESCTLKALSTARIRDPKDEGIEKAD